MTGLQLATQLQRFAKLEAPCLAKRWDDPDGDLLFNVEEFHFGTNPRALKSFSGTVIIPVQNPVTFTSRNRAAVTDYEAAKRALLPPGLRRGTGPDAALERDDDWDGDGASNLGEATAAPAISTDYSGSRVTCRRDDGTSGRPCARAPGRDGGQYR